MLKNCRKKAFVFFSVFSFLIANSHFNSLFVFETHAFTSTVSVKATTVNVRSGPGTDYKILGTLSLGFKIVPLEEVKDKNLSNKTWYKFAYEGGGMAYIRSDFCKDMKEYSYDAEFEAELNMKGFPETYKPGLRDLHANYPKWIFTLQDLGIDFSYAVDQELVGTRTLVRSNAISSYKSTEPGKYDYKTSTWPTFDGNAWVCASREVTACYMDPRNFLYNPYVFQFEHQTFNVTIHSLDGIKEMVKGTFLDAKVNTEGLVSNTAAVNTNVAAGSNNQSNVIMPWDMATPILPVAMNNSKEVEAFSNVYIAPNGPGSDIEKLGPAANISNSSSGKTSATEEPTSFAFTYLPKGTYTYAELIYDACKQVNANPYVIVSMILQEQGKDGSDSVSGKNKKYPNTYNFGNINAFASGGLTAIENGLKYASETGSYNRPWNTKEKGIYGLCDFYANSYVKGGQDTFYLKKWNVQGDNMFKHQYMTNVAGAASEGQILGNAYDDTMLAMPHEFKIPVYRNMPEVNCPMPTGDGSPNNKLKSLSVTNFTITPTFDPDTHDYTLIVDSNVNQVFINAEAYDKKAAVGGIGYVNLVTSNTIAIVYCVAENGNIGQYNINIYKKGAENVQVENTITPDQQATINFQSMMVVEAPQVGVGPGQ